jgi:putative oxidoreductase
MRIGRLLARLFVGSLFFAHGTQKLFGWFGGPGLDGASRMMDSLEMKPGRRNAIAASVSETAGGAMLAAGALTPVAATALIGTMLTAIRKVHLEKGFFASQGGYEFNLTLVAALLALIDGGPGPISVDGALGLECTGSGWALASLAAGAGGSALAIAAGEHRAGQEMSEQAPASGDGTAPEARTAESEPQPQAS